MKGREVIIRIAVAGGSTASHSRTTGPRRQGLASLRLAWRAAGGPSGRRRAPPPLGAGPPPAARAGGGPCLGGGGGEAFRGRAVLPFKGCGSFLPPYAFRHLAASS